MNFKERIENIITEIQKLISICYPDFDLKIEYLTIFAQSKQDYLYLRRFLQKLGEEIEANNGYKYKLRTTTEHQGEKIELIRVRKPDVHRKELGCADLKYDARDYSRMRETALNKGMDIIIRKGYEMIELSTFEINVYAYLVKDVL